MADSPPPQSPLSAANATLPEFAAVQAGDEVAFRALFDALLGPLNRYARSFADDVATAEDLVQEAFVRLWDRRASLTADISLHGYLCRTVRNLALNSRRDRATRQRLLSDPAVHDGAASPSALPHPDAELEGDEMGERLAAYLADLPPRQREAIHLSRFEGLSHSEVAMTMGCSPRTVNNHLVAALSTLRRRLSDVGSLVAAVAVWLT